MSRLINSTPSTTKSIVYVNFSPYENAGKILDYLLQNFALVALFSFSFHRLKNKKDSNKLKIYRNGKLIETKSLFDYQLSDKLVFLFLPIRSSFIFLQLLTYATYLRIRYGKFQYYLTVNAFTAWVGNILRFAGIVKKTIFWVWDYYPLTNANKIIMFMRWVYWQFDKQATQSDMLIFLNKRVVRLRQDMGRLGENTGYKIIPIGTDADKGQKVSRSSRPKGLTLVFIGVIKKSQGLDLLFDNCGQLLASFPNMVIHIVGAGPDLDYFRGRAKSSDLNVIFHEYLEDKKRDRILTKSDIGIATYIPEKDNVAYYGDPSKIKQYLSFGIPVITTNVFDFSSEVEKEKAGIIVDYYNKSSLTKAIRAMEKNLSLYKKNAAVLGKKYYYRTLYKDLFG